MADKQNQRGIGQDIKIRHADPYIIVVEKPAGLTTVRHAHEAAEFGQRARKYLPTTLVDVLQQGQKDKRQRIRAVHRLDKDTSGLLVLACTVDAERRLGEQFRKHTIERRYLALVRGLAVDERIESFLVDDRGDGRRGSSWGGTGQKAITQVSVLEQADGFTLVECRLETGRTHQVRIHLGERGTPLCGERVYDRPLHGRPLPDGSGMKRPALHASFLAIDHPNTGKRMTWQSALPADMKQAWQKLQK